MRLAMTLLSAALRLSMAADAQSPAPPQAAPPSTAQGVEKNSLPAAPAPKPISTEMRGDIAMARKMYREAIEFYKQVEPKTAVILNKLGIAHHQMMDLSGAKRYYEQSLKKNKQYPEAINNLGTVAYAQKSYRRAVGQYNKALRYAPNSASIYSNLGTAWFARKKYDRAFEAYQKALELDPEVFEHRSTSGVLLQERSVEERAKFHFYLAKTYAAAGVFDRALLYIRKALEEGFKDKQKLIEDPAFASMKETPEFQELLALNPRVL